ncbi:hypothetical protein HPB47_005250, partial [Ixodes persulcatus]
MDGFGWVMLGDDTSARFWISCVNELTVPTTRHRTCIDLVFTENVPAVSVHPMEVCHSDHKSL